MECGTRGESNTVRHRVQGQGWAGELEESSRREATNLTFEGCVSVVPLISIDACLTTACCYYTTAVRRAY